MAARHFSVEEANRVIPELETGFTLVMQLRAQLRVAYQALQTLGEPPTAESVARQAGSPALRRARGRFRALMEALAEGLQTIEATGVTIKDLDSGLCDFLGLRDGREVWLCWQYGEKRIAYWHDLDVGFAGRQPLAGPAATDRLPH